MCVFTGQVDNVSATKIFAALVAPYTQFTVYSNKVALAGSGQKKNLYNSPTFFNSSLFPGYSPAGLQTHGMYPHPGMLDMHQSNNVFWENGSQWSAFHPDNLQVYDPQGEPVAMVLAVPLPTGDAKSIKMVDMSNCKDIFTKLEETMPSEFITFSGTFSAQCKSSAPLAVKRCGPYSYSIVPDIASFTRLKHNKFKVNPRVFDIMRQHYPRGYAFLVCIIDKSAEYSPIAYTHPSDGKNLFVPTLHEHGHSGEEIETDDWDHSIYTIDRDSGTRVTDRRNVNASITKAEKSPRTIGFPYRNLNWNNLKRRKISGYNPNGDILIRV